MKEKGRLSMKRTMNASARRVLITVLALVCLGLAGCTGNVGVGLSVGVPIGDHGYMSVGGGRWY
jgi:hypothetical protein